MTNVFRLQDVEKRLERRWRRRRGMRFGSLAFALASAPLPLAALVRYLLLSETSVASALPWFGLPFLCAGVAFGVGWARRPNLPRLLLQVDVALGTKERLSALHELRQTRQGRPFRRQIEASLQGDSFPWKKGLPIGSLPLLVTVAGTIALAGAVFLLSVEPRAAPHKATVPLPSTAAQAAGQPSTAAAPLASDAGSGQDTSVASTPTPSGGMPEQSLENLLAGIWGSPESKGVLSESPADLGKLSADGTSGPKQLSQLLSQLEQRLAQSPGPLTPQEREQLSNLLDQIPDQSLREALESLLNDEQSDSLKNDVAKARLMAENAASQDGAAPPDGGGTNPTKPGQGDTTASGLPDAQNPDANPKEGPAMSRDDPGSSPSDGESAARRVQGDDESLTGGDEATPPRSAAEDEQQAQRPMASFAPKELSGIIGTSGDSRAFLTKGVPLEAAPQGEGRAPQLSVDYEMLQAILTERALPPGTQDSVRRYFNAITQGGP